MYDLVRIKEDEDNYLQIRCTNNPMMVVYEKGDEIPELEDGLYVGYEGWFVIEDSTITAVGVNAFDKWGKRLNFAKAIKLSPDYDGDPLYYEVESEEDKKWRRNND